MKLRLGPKKIVNWFNFLKEESDRSLEKLAEIKNYNIKFKLKTIKFKINIRIVGLVNLGDCCYINIILYSIYTYQWLWNLIIIIFLLKNLI